MSLGDDAGEEGEEMTDTTNRDRLLRMLDEKDQKIRSLYRELDRAQQTITEMRVGLEAVAQALEEDGEEWELAETLRSIAQDA